MSSLSATERRDLEILLDMGQGYVLDFGDRTFGEFFESELNIDIHSSRYQTNGTSKAKKLRCFWKNEPDYIVANALDALLIYEASLSRGSFPNRSALARRCREIADRLRTSSSVPLEPLKDRANKMDSKHLAEQVRRIELAIHEDPSLAIGTAKELYETCCKTILLERGVVVSSAADVPALSKETFKILQLTPDHVPNSAKGSDVIRRLLSNLSTVGIGIAELRNLYGTGHGKHAGAVGLSSRHAKLATGAIIALVTFLFETHEETKSSRSGES